MVSIVAPGPYIGDLSSELRQQDPAAILQKARISLESVSVFKEAVVFLREQIESLAKNTLDKINNIPDFNKLSGGEIALSKLDHQDTPKLLEVIKFIREAFSLQRFQHQTKEITAVDQKNFARLLNQRIDPITKEGIRAKDRKNPDPYQKAMSSVAPMILAILANIFTQDQNKLKNINQKFKDTFDIKTVTDELFSMIRKESSKFIAEMEPFFSKESGETLKEAILSIVGGFDNAVAGHLAFVKVAFEKLKQEIPDLNSHVFKFAWSNVLENLSHISRQLSSVQGLTLKLIENLNGVKTNQTEAYHFDADNFELVREGNNFVLLPTITFLEKIIKMGNDNATEIHSNFELLPGQKTVNFAEVYLAPQGCPIHGVKADIGGTKHKFEESFFMMIGLIKESAFGLFNKVS